MPVGSLAPKHGWFLRLCGASPGLPAALAQHWELPVSKALDGCGGFHGTSIAGWFLLGTTSFKMDDLGVLTPSGNHHVSFSRDFVCRSIAFNILQFLEGLN